MDIAAPKTGDVLITYDRGLYLISIVPHPHRLSFKEFAKAFGIAEQWARANGVTVWQSVDGSVAQLPVASFAVKPKPDRRKA